MNFYYHGSIREKFGFSTPNEAGLFLATVLPVICALIQINASKWKSRIFSFSFPLILAAGWYYLAKTYSRGAIVAALCGLGYFFLCMPKFDDRAVDTKYRRLLILNLSLGLIFVLFLGLQGRFLAIAGGDRSAWNRFPLWLGAFQLIGASPFRSWGPGESGLAYMQWVQPIGDPMVYGSMVNSYFTVILERGPFIYVPLAMIVSTHLVLCFFSVESLSVWKKFLQLGLTGSLVSFLAGSFFSTFWANGYIVTIGACFCVGSGILYSNVIQISACLDALRKGVVFSGLFCAAMIGTGLYVNANAPIKISRRQDGGITLVSKNGSHLKHQSITILTDNVTLGKLYGKSLRRSLGELPAWDEITVYGPERLPRGSAQAHIMVLGDRINDIDSRISANSITIVAPIASKLPKFPDRTLAVYLPSVPLLDTSINWDAGDHKFPVITIEGYGQNIERRLAVILRESLVRF